MFGRLNKEESGAIVVNGQHVASTRQCVHCGSHERIVSGSGKKRGFCVNCTGFLCGKAECMNNCIPFEARLEYQEAINSSRIDLITKLTSRYPAIKQLSF